MLRPFALHGPGTAEEACALLATLGEDAAPYAGGTELLLLMKLGLLRPRHLVDVKRLAGFDVITDGGSLTLGAAVTHRAVERSPLAVALALVLDASRARVTEARVTVGCVDPRPVRVPSVEARLRGVAVPELQDVAGAIGELAAAAVEPDDDLHGSADYKREMVAVFVRRALRIAAGRARGASTPIPQFPHAVIA